MVVRRIRLTQLTVALSGLALIWYGSVAGHALFALLGIEYHYTHTPALVSAYMTVWLALLLAFYPHTLRKVPIGNLLDSAALLIAFFGLLALLYGVLLPALPAPVALAQLYPETYFLSAGPAYVIPKSLEIALQQSIIVAMILLFASYFRSFRSIVFAYATLFTVAHLLLVAFWPENVFFLIFTLAALCSSLIFPYLILKVRNGFIYSYIVHWLFYVVLTLWFWL